VVAVSFVEGNFWSDYLIGKSISTFFIFVKLFIKACLYDAFKSFILYI
jgi:hypothetical protein